MNRRPNSVHAFKSYKVEEAPKHRDHGPSHRLKDFLSFIEDSPKHAPPPDLTIYTP